MGKNTEEKHHGKNTEEKHHGGIPNDKSNPNRKWVKMLNNLNVLDYHRWKNVKKILPHKKHGEEKDGSEAIEPNDEDKANVDDKGHQCNGDVCTIGSSKPKPQPQPQSEPELEPEEKTPKDSNSAARKGRAARIKARITKEVLKKRVMKHKRSSTCPPSTDQSHEGVQLSNEGSVDSQRTSVAKDTDSIDTTDEKHDDPCSTRVEYDVEGEVDAMTERGTLDGENSKDDDLDTSEEEQTFPLKLKNNEHFGRSATFHQSKELLDAMDVLSMNKDFFLKVLEDPEASLAQHFMVQQASSSKRKHLDKSRTFSHMSASSSSSTRKSFSTLPLDNLPKREVDGKQFKDLRQKIKHVIKESKEERQRIALDSVLHKVPFGQHCSETKKDTVENLNLEIDDSKRSRNDKKKIVKRSDSLNVSMERYCQLFETNLSKVSKNTNSDNPKLQVKDENESRKPLVSLGRMSSSPDLTMFLSGSSSRLPSGIPMPRKLMKTSMSFNELNSLHILSSLEKSGTKHGFEETDESNVTRNPAIGLDEPFRSFLSYSNSQEDNVSLNKPTIPLQVMKTDSCLSQQTDLFSIGESTSDVEKLEFETLDHLPSSSRHVRVKSKDQGHFDYVKDILQLSGYSENQALGTWQATNQPVDPSLFAELESCSFQEPDCTETEEVTRCNRLLLFDSINEVLLSTYESSTAYWNSPLTTCSRIHPMPKGYRVLEEVWSHISWYLNSAANQLESSLDVVIMHDFGEDDGWMNLQFEAEGTALELEELIFEDLLMDILPSLGSAHA